MSHKAKRPVRSTAAAEILAAGEAIDEGKMIAHTVSLLFGIKVELIIILDSKDLFTSLSTQKNSIDKSVRADVSVIRFEFECGNVSTFKWIPGKNNLADPGTKPDSPLTESLCITLAEGRLSVDFNDAESRRYDRPLG